MRGGDTMQRTLIAFVLLATPIVNAQNYTVTDLGSLSPTAVNAWGQVAGNLKGQATVWTQFTGSRSLGLLPGGTFSTAAGINDLGQIVGAADVPTALCDGQYIAQTVAFLWTRTQGMQNLGSISVGGYPACVFSSYAWDINVVGQVAGTQGKSSTTYVDGFLWTEMGNITLLNGIYNSAAYGINGRGQMVGKSGFFLSLDSQPEIDAEGANATLWDKAQFSEIGDRCSIALNINDFEQVVGWFQSGTTDCSEGVVPHAFLWTRKEGIRDLGVLPGATTSVANKINFFGQVIGYSDGLAFVWTRNKGMLDLNTLVKDNAGWILRMATGINAWGQIVGSGTLNGVPHGFLLTPTSF